MADFMTIDISSMFGNQEASNETKPNSTEDNNEKTATANNKPESKKPASKVDWSKELKKRLDDNRALDPEARESEYNIEAGFWQDFFKANWPEDIAELLDIVIGEQLKKDIKVLGFKKQTNPIIAFLKLSYVQKELIKTRLINNNTYKAIHNAVAKQYIADSEFFKASDYNIIYCKDLYSKSVSDIEAYLKIQKTILPTNISEYTVDRQNRNKSIFLEVGKKSVKQKGVTLKSLKEVQKLTGVSVEEVSNKNEKEGTTSEQEEKGVNLDASELVAFIGNSPAKTAAALQFIGMTSKHPKAFSALKRLGNIPMEALASAASEVAKKFSNVKINAKSAENYINLIVNKVIPYL